MSSARLFRRLIVARPLKWVQTILRGLAPRFDEKFVALRDIL